VNAQVRPVSVRPHLFVPDPAIPPDHNGRRGCTCGLTREQVAYIIRLSYNLGLSHGHAYDTAELLATWADRPSEPPSPAEQPWLTDEDREFIRSYLATGRPVDG
jgi:hypothetical protein